ncbi:hypothetical protein Bca52824_000994 [Brassica carinata]|uniref:DUF676 domain-containing protein n=1 Tax=Brassica carinata TaxID=52824 RepID=A0A8X8B9D0_BRACI|nr:hypothetical protein Bca52824_000994 [Brassica carinata]
MTMTVMVVVVMAEIMFGKRDNVMEEDTTEWGASVVVVMVTDAVNMVLEKETREIGGGEKIDVPKVMDFGGGCEGYSDGGPMINVIMEEVMVITKDMIVIIEEEAVVEENRTNPGKTHWKFHRTSGGRVSDSGFDGDGRTTTLGLLSQGVAKQDRTNLYRSELSASRARGKRIVVDVSSTDTRLLVRARHGIRTLRRVAEGKQKQRGAGKDSLRVKMRHKVFQKRKSTLNLRPAKKTYYWEASQELFYSGDDELSEESKKRFKGSRVRVKQRHMSTIQQKGRFCKRLSTMEAVVEFLIVGWKEPESLRMIIMRVGYKPLSSLGQYLREYHRNQFVEADIGHNKITLSEDRYSKQRRPLELHGRKSGFPDQTYEAGSESNSSTLTFDGVDMMGERLANKVLSVVKNIGGGLKNISFVAHSLGGLVARYAVGKVYEQQLVIKVSYGFIDFAAFCLDHDLAVCEEVRRKCSCTVVSNSSTLTFDGVDMMGERLANKVLSVVKNIGGLKNISFVAHSLGGLVARYRREGV